MNKNTLFEYKELTASEAINIISIPNFQRDVDSRNKKIANAYTQAGSFTSEPIYCIRDGDKLSLIDGQHRYGAYLIAIESGMNGVLPVIIRNGDMINSPKEEFLKSNNSKPVSFRHKMYIHDVMQELKRSINIVPIATSSSSIASADLVKGMSAYMDLYVNQKSSSSVVLNEDMQQLKFISNIVYEIATMYHKQCKAVGRTFQQQAFMMMCRLSGEGYNISTEEAWHIAKYYFKTKISKDSYQLLVDDLVMAMSNCHSTKELNKIKALLLKEKQ